MYRKPEVDSYSGPELQELMGPVETQYGCDLDCFPDTVPPGGDTTYVVDFSSLPNFDTVLFEVVDVEFLDVTVAEARGASMNQWSVPRSSGEEKGTDWSYQTSVMGSLGTRITVEARLAAGETVSEPCSTQIIIGGLPVQVP